MQILISGGPGSGCSSTGQILGQELGVSVLDSDSFFHKPTDPPFQEQYSPDERRRLLTDALAEHADWIVSGSIATWGLPLSPVSYGIFLNTPREERLRRLMVRERERFGERIDPGGDMNSENTAFMKWAAEYEERSGKGRNRGTDRNFLRENCVKVLEIDDPGDLRDVVSRSRQFLGR